MSRLWNKFLKSNKTQWRLLRTIIQGILSVLIANVDLLIGGFEIPIEYKAVLVPAIMSILSPIFSCIKTQGKQIEPYGGEREGNSDVEHEDYEPSDSNTWEDDE